MKTVRLLLAALLSCLVVAARPAAQGLYRDLHPARVWTVNAAGGADFIDLPEAVRAARSGDVLLVAPGDYTAFELRGKSPTIVGDGGPLRQRG